MKRFSLILALFATVLTSFTAIADEDDDDRRRRRRGGGGIKMEVNLNVGQMAYGRFGVMPNFILGENMTAGIDLGFRVRSEIISEASTLNATTMTGFYASPEFRYYFAPKEGADRWFAGIYTTFEQTSGDFTTTSYDNNGFPTGTTDHTRSNARFGAGVLGGWQYVLNDHWVFAGFVGYGYFFVDNQTDSPEIQDDGSGSGFPSGFGAAVEAVSNADYRYGISVGYRF